MKRYRKFEVVMIGIICIFLSACGKKKKAEEQMNTDVLFPYDGATYSENYVLYTKSGKDGCLWFFDVATKSAGPYCFDPSCEHKRAVYDDMNGIKIEEGCLAYEIDRTPFPCGEYLYYYQEYPLRLYRTNRQGNNRELIAEPDGPYGNIFRVYYTDEALYLGYTIEYEYTQVETNSGKKEWRAGKLRDKREAGILRISYDGKTDVIYQSDEYYTMLVAEIHYYDGKLRFLVQGEDRPHVNLDIMAPDFKEQLAEDRKHQVTEAYEYTISTKELKKTFQFHPYTVSYFFDEMYGVLDDSGRLILYNYDGDKVAESEIAPMDVVTSDHGIIGVDKTTQEYVMLDEKTGKVLKRTPLIWEDMSLFAVVGDSYYGYVQNSRAYISAEDYWAGNKEGIVIFPGEPKVNITSMPTVEPEPPFTVSSEDPPYETSNEITWVYWFALGIPKQNRQEINRLLYEKGYDCQIRFVRTEEEGAEYEGWLQEYEKQYGSPDIISTGIWNAEEIYRGDMLRFAKEHILPFNEHMETDAWKAVKELYTEEEWNSVSVDGIVYGVPRALIGTQESHGLDTCIYATVNENYAGYFDSFDGTYASLKEIYREIGNDKLKIVIDEIASEGVLYGLLGYETVQSFAYQKDTHRVVDLSKTNELRNLVSDMYQDLKSGVLVNHDREEAPSDKNLILAYIHSKKMKPEEGFRDYLIAQPHYGSSGVGMYGVSVDSKQKDLAFEIMAVCYSDPEIRCLMTGIDDRELLDQRVELLSENPNDELLGFRVFFTEEQARVIRNSVDNSALLRLMNDMYYVVDYDSDGGIIRELNPDFNIDASWSEYVSKFNGLDDIYATVNRQLKEWFDR